MVDPRHPPEAHVARRCSGRLSSRPHVVLGPLSRQVTSTLAVLAWERSFIVVDFELAQTEEDDLRSIVEADLDQGVVSRRRRNDGMNAAALADPAPMDVGEIRGCRRGHSNGYGAADENAAAQLCIALFGEFGLVGLHGSNLRSRRSGSFGDRSRWLYV